jgi:hypothetical protein
MVCLTGTCVGYLDKDLFLARFLFNIVPKIWDLINDIKNLIFFTKCQCYILFKEGR